MTTNLENAERAEMGWRPIETAPKDGTWFLGFHRGRCVIYRWSQRQFDKHGNGWDFTDNGLHSPTHWQPLPAAPGEARIRSCLIDKPEAGEAADDSDPLVPRLLGRAKFLRDIQGETKTALLLIEAATALSPLSAGDAGEIERLRKALEFEAADEDGRLMTLEEVADALLRAREHDQKLVGYRGDLWTVMAECLEARRAALTQEPTNE